MTSMKRCAPKNPRAFSFGLTLPFDFTTYELLQLSIFSWLYVWIYLESLNIQSNFLPTAKPEASYLFVIVIMINVIKIKRVAVSRGKQQ